MSKASEVQQEMVVGNPHETQQATESELIQPSVSAVMFENS